MIIFKFTFILLSISFIFTLPVPSFQTSRSLLLLEVLNSMSLPLYYHSRIDSLFPSSSLSHTFILSLSLSLSQDQNHNPSRVFPLSFDPLLFCLVLFPASHLATSSFIWSPRILEIKNFLCVPLVFLNRIRKRITSSFVILNGCFCFMPLTSIMEEIILRWPSFCIFCPAVRSSSCQRSCDDS